MPKGGYVPTHDVPEKPSPHLHLRKCMYILAIFAGLAFAATAFAQSPRRHAIRKQLAQKHRRHRQRHHQHHDPPATQSTTHPVGVPGNWTLSFDDEFNGTSVNTSQWTNSWFNGGTMNNVATSPSNVSVGGGVLTLTLSSSGTGALIHTTQATGRATVAVGDVVEARIWFPGHGTTIYNWPAFWANDTDNYPAGGENDIAEGLGDLTVNYHSPSGTHNQGSVPGVWSAGWHTYALWRQAGHCDVYWDGQLVKSYSTDDDAAPEDIILNVGAGEGPTVTGPAGAVKVDYVRVWRP
jgi:hypothetical protein